ncbi:MAG: allantoicase [Deltaproteobacteria bacterium]|nr:allantoicase [Deltaproteobacteria bacterium]
MSSRQKSPPEFAHLVNLAEDLTGTFVVSASDDYFAEKENLIRPDAPRWEEDKYTDKGKWMDGWESQRRRTPGHDQCVIRLGTPGFVHGLVVDTTWFRGNAPTHVELEGVEAPHTATAEELAALTTWTPILGNTAVEPHTANLIKLKTPSSSKASHVRLRIFPDGGVARLRVFGVVGADERTFWRAGAVDLAAIENGGTIAAVSDEFFGPPSNLLLPGRGVNMGDGWETKRRRTPGSDWCVIKLARRGVVERIELDTAFFKGNAPQAVVVECIDEESPSIDKLRTLGGWPVLVGKTPLVQHRRHTLEPERPTTTTHLRVHIFPHGGVNRLRVFGHALDSADETQALRHLADADDELYLSFCASKTWAKAVKKHMKGAPSSVRGLFEAVEEAFWKLNEKDLLEAFSAHPKIGEHKAAVTATARSATWSTAEQAAAGAASSSTSQRLAELNQQYAEKFGFIYIVFASGKSADLMLEILESRVHNDRAVEIDIAAREQMKITRNRLERWLRAQVAFPTVRTGA